MGNFTLRDDIANSARSIRGWRLLVIDPGRLAETYDANKHALEREKKTSKARQRLARETRISGGPPRQYCRRPSREKCGFVKAAKPVYHACRARSDREHDSVGYLLLTMRLSKTNLTVCIQSLCETNLSNSSVPPAPLFCSVRGLPVFRVRSAVWAAVDGGNAGGSDRAIGGGQYGHTGDA
jgi:hypothetical protein